MAKTLTTSEVLTKASLGSRQTLMRYAQEGLVSPPEFGPSRSGRGRTCHWNPRVVDQCRQIRKYKADGLSIAEIKDALETGDRSTRRKKTILDQDAQTIQIAETITREIKRIARFSKDERASRLLTLDHLQTARALAAEGISPVLVISELKVHVVPDFAVAVLVAEAEPAAMLLLPLASFVQDELAGAARRTQPMTRVIELDNQTVQVGEQSHPAPTVRDVQRVGDMDYRVVDLD